MKCRLYFNTNFSFSRAKNVGISLAMATLFKEAKGKKSLSLVIDNRVLVLRSINMDNRVFIILI